MNVYLLGLVTWRLSRILPLDVIAQGLRDRITIWTYSETSPQWREKAYDMLHCPLCLSMHVAGAVTGCWDAYAGWLGWAWLWQWAAVWAVSSVVTLLLGDMPE